jgi:hypothetical protein
MLERPRWFGTGTARPSHGSAGLGTNGLSWPRSAWALARYIGQRPTISCWQRAAITSGHGPARRYRTRRRPRTRRRGIRRCRSRPCRRRLGARRNWRPSCWCCRSRGCGCRGRRSRFRSSRHTDRRRSRRLRNNLRNAGGGARGNCGVGSRSRGLSHWRGGRNWCRSSRLHGCGSGCARLRGHSRGGRPHPSGLCRSFLCFLLRLRGRFRLSFGFRDSLNCLANFLGYVDGNRARVRFFLGDTKTRQKVNDRFGLDLQFTGQFVDSDLIRVGHSSFALLRLCFFSFLDFTLVFGRRWYN